MFESYLTNLLSTHFGHLFTNISRDNVSISAWRGEVVLKDLGIRREALQVLLGASRGGGDVQRAGRDSDADGYEEEFDGDNDESGDILEDGEWHDAGHHDSATAKCPFQIEHGTIGTFELHIPSAVELKEGVPTAPAIMPSMTMTTD